MPPWGRPPGARLGREARWRAAQQVDDSVRFEEIGSDGDDDAFGMQDDLSFHAWRQGVGMDEGYGRRRRALEYDQYTDDGESVDGIDIDLRGDGDSTVAYAVQLAMKDKEEWLVEKALERIRRAQMLGKENVRLSKREVEALERKRMQAEPRRKIGIPMTPERRKKQAESPESVTAARPRPFSNVPSSPARSTGARPPSSSGPRTPVTYSPRSQQAMAGFRTPYPYSPDRYQYDSGSRPSSSSRKEGLPRPLPDDPRWVPPYWNMPQYVPYSPESSPYQAYMPFDVRHPPLGHEMGYPPGLPAFNPGYRSFSDARRSSSTSNSPSPHIGASDSGTEDSSEESSVDSGEADAAERKESPSVRKQAAGSRESRQRANR